MKKETSPFRVTLILSESGPVAQIESIERIIDDDGSLIASTVLPAKPLEMPLSESVIGAVSAAALAQIDTLKTDHEKAIAELTEKHAEELAEKEAAHKTHVSDLVDSASEVVGKFNEQLAAKDAEIEALRNPPVPETPELISQLNTAFKSALPPEAQLAFAMPYAIVRVLVQAGELELAKSVITGIAVPPELEDAKSALLSLFA